MDTKIREAATTTGSDRRGSRSRTRRATAHANNLSTLFTMVVIVYALFTGQLKAITSNGIEFYSTGDKVSQEKVEAAQPALQEDTSERLDKADEAAGSTDSQLPDIDGGWVGDNGLSYYVYQHGDQVVMQEFTDAGMTAVGSGTFDGATVQLEYQAADWSTGHAELSLENPSTLTGSFYNYDSGTSVPATLRR